MRSEEKNGPVFAETILRAGQRRELGTLNIHLDVGGRRVLLILQKCVECRCFDLQIAIVRQMTHRSRWFLAKSGKAVTV